MFLRMKSDPLPGRRRLSDELFNCGEDSQKLLTRFFPIARPLPKRTMQSIQRRPRTSYSSRRARAAQHAGKHRDSLFSKGVRQVTPAAAPGV